MRFEDCILSIKHNNRDTNKHLYHFEADKIMKDSYFKRLPIYDIDNDSNLCRFCGKEFKDCECT